MSPAGIYSERETHLPQPLRISVRVLLDCAPHYRPEGLAAQHVTKKKFLLDPQARQRSRAR